MKIDPKSAQDITQVTQAKNAAQTVKPAHAIKSDGVMAGDQAVSLRASLSQEQLQILHYLIQNYSGISMFETADELAGLLVPVMEQGSTEVAELVKMIQVQFAALKETYAGKEIDQSMVRKAFEIFRGIEGLKNNLVTLLDRLSNQPQAAGLRARIENFLNQLETIKLFNHQGLSTTTHDALLYFPLRALSDIQQNQRLGIWVKPQFRHDGTLDNDSVSFAISVESQTLGDLVIHCQVDGKKFSCHANAEYPQTEKLMRDNISDLESRLKSIKYELSGFTSRFSPHEAQGPGLVSRIETIV